MLEWGLLLAVTAVLAAVLYRRLPDQPLLASGYAAFGGAMLFQIADRLYWHYRVGFSAYFDPFWRMGTYVLLVVTVPTALVVVYALRAWDRRSAGRSDEHP